MFNSDQETLLEEYMLSASQYGNQYAISIELKVPDSWEEKKCAGNDWFWSFLKRQPKLSIRKPEATSMARATSFNKHNVSFFLYACQCS